MDQQPCGFRAISVNCTSLTDTRLHSILDEADNQTCDFICLQETRHPDDGFKWATYSLQKRGWSVQWSPSAGYKPTKKSASILREGGTALLWRSRLGRGKKLHFPDQSCVARQWKFGIVASVYGPVSVDCDWFAKLLAYFDSRAPILAIGDFNWAEIYKTFTVDGWQVSDHHPTTIGGRTAPTRMMWNYTIGTTAPEAVFPILDIPHHCATVWKADLELGQKLPEPRRLHRCARYKPCGDPLPDDYVVVKQYLKTQTSWDRSVQWTSPKDWCVSIDAALGKWHNNLEHICKLATQWGCMEMENKPERAKGSIPSSRPQACSTDKSKHDSINTRRCNALFRAAAEQHRNGNVDTLTCAQQRHWKAAIDSNLFGEKISVPQNQIKAMEIASVAARSFASESKRAFLDDWKRTFAFWTHKTCTAAGRILKPSCRSSTTAEEIKHDWLPNLTAPPHDDGPDKWLHCTQVAGMKPLPMGSFEPVWHDLHYILYDARGADGLDGWSAKEAKWLNIHFPQMTEELFLMLMDFIKHVTWVDMDLMPNFKTFFAWRLAGVPKRSGDKCRPVAVGSIYLRAWHQALIKFLPSLPDDQACGKKGYSIIHATLEWLGHQGGCGAETDLTSAFDTIDWDVADQALIFAGCHKQLVDYLRFSWAGQRFCSLNGAITDPGLPSRGIPQGDPPSPNVMAQGLRPWQPFVKVTTPSIKGWLYCDDRSIRGSGDDKLSVVRKAITATAEFDEAAGLTKNLDKDQIWSSTSKVEHLGLIFTPNKPAPPLLRDGWAPVYNIIGLLPRLPGGIGIRDVAALTFIKAKYTWSAPLCPVPPRNLDMCLMKAILNTRCSWWCRARFWMQRIELHPKFGTAIAVAKALNRFMDHKHNPTLVATVNHHLNQLNLTIRQWDDNQCLVTVDDKASPAWMTFKNFCPDGSELLNIASDKSAHALRSLARRLAIDLVSTDRNDCEGMQNIDLEATSSRTWTRWVAVLNEEQNMHLRIYRTGAVWSQTRTQRKIGEIPKCMWCDTQYPSFRHIWTECKRYDTVRSELQVEYGIASSWWQLQPRCTSKTGWITMTAHHCKDHRARLQVATCRLALVIIPDMWAHRHLCLDSVEALARA